MITKDNENSPVNLPGADLLTVYESIFQSITDAVIYADTSRRIIYINNAAIKLFGYLPHDVQGKSTEILYANKSDFINQGNKRYSSKNSDNPHAFELDYKRKDGSTFIGETVGNHVNDPDGNLLGFVGVVRNVAKRNETIALATRLGRIVEDSLNEVYLFDDESLYFIEVNRGARENLGYSMTQLRNLTPYDIKPDFNKEQFVQLLAPLRNGDQDIMQLVTTHQRKDGTTYPVEVHLQRVIFDESTIYLAIILDITERKHAENELAQHRENLEEMVSIRSATLRDQARIIDQIHDSVISTDIEGNITNWNKGAERLFGYSADEMRGRHISSVYLAEEYQHFQKKVINPLFENGEHESELRMRRKNGEDFFAHLSLSLLHDDTGKTKGIVGYSIDISKRKHAEMLAQKRLEELEGFSYTVSHDLRSPLRAIDGFSQILLNDYKDKLDENANNHLSRIRNAAQRMGHLIDDLLQLAQVNRGELKRNQVNLGELTQNAVTLHQEASPNRATTISIMPDIIVQGDHGLLQILIENLIDNAWKYSSAKDRTYIGFGQKTINHEPVYFIEDKGSGFNTQYSHRLFGPFERLHGNDEFSGTGIGLATVERIVHRHGGRIWADAEPDKGATFYFTLESDKSNPDS